MQLGGKETTCDHISYSIRFANNAPTDPYPREELRLVRGRNSKSSARASECLAERIAAVLCFVGDSW